MNRRSMVALAMLLGGCSQSSDSFAVRVIGGEARAADVTVCGKTSSLTRRSDGAFTGRRRIDCEGDGEVRVTLRNGAVVRCPVGYVTSLHQDWSFTVNGNTCAGA